MKTYLIGIIFIAVLISCNGSGPVIPDYGPPHFSMYCPCDPVPPTYPISGIIPQPLPTFIDGPGTWWHYDRCVICHKSEPHYALVLCRSYEKYWSEYDKWGIERMAWLVCE